MPNLELTPKTKLSTFRRIALGTWRTVGDPSVYGTMTLRVDDALRYIEAFRKATGKRVTLTHLMCKAMGGVYQRMPDANSILRFGRIYLRARIGVFFQAVLEDPRTGEYDLSGLTILDPEKKSLSEIVAEFEERVEKVRTGKDRELEQSRSIFKRLPFWLLRPVLDLMGFLTLGLNLDLRRFGVPKDPFGSLMITNIGSLGIDEAYVPLVPYSRVPLLIAMGAVQEVPIVHDGEITVGKVMRLNVTFDHRVIDGAHAAIMAKTLKDWFGHPFERFDPIPSNDASP